MGHRYYLYPPLKAWICLSCSCDGSLQPLHRLLEDLQHSVETDFCCEALKEALERRKPEYFNTDQGAQFTSKKFISILQSEKIKIRMDGKGRVIDNIFIERFWRTLKYEEVYTKSYETVWECRKSIGEFIEKYNAQRLHQSLKEYDTPLEAYLQMKLAVAC